MPLPMKSKEKERTLLDFSKELNALVSKFEKIFGVQNLPLQIQGKLFSQVESR